MVRTASDGARAPLRASSQRAGKAWTARQGVARTSYDGDIDYGKVIAVNQWALRRHATVMWVNYPTRPERLARNDG